MFICRPFKSTRVTETLYFSNSWRLFLFFKFCIRSKTHTRIYMQSQWYGVDMEGVWRGGVWGGCWDCTGQRRWQNNTVRMDPLSLCLSNEWLPFAEQLEMIECYMFNCSTYSRRCLPTSFYILDIDWTGKNRSKLFADNRLKTYNKKCI